MFIMDLASRLSNRIQLTSDGLNVTIRAVDEAFGYEGIDYAILHKLYANPSGKAASGRYSPAECIGAERRPVMGFPDPERISTSYVERQNLTMRMGMRRFTPLTNASPTSCPRAPPARSSSGRSRCRKRWSLPNGRRAGSHSLRSSWAGASRYKRSA